MMRRTLILITVGLLSLTLIGYSSGFIFAQTPAISLSRTSGSPGGSVSVTGSGFSGNETSITVTFDGASVTSGITASSAGAWTSSFTIPASASGNHTVDAYGSITQATSVADISFIVTPSISLSRASGPSGTTITVTGSGFAASETSITVTYDGTSVASSISASSLGSWTSTFNIPASAAGSHTIDAYGSVSQATNVPDMTFTVSAGIAINRTSGPPGTTVTITGSGFGAGETGITVTYDDSLVVSGITANSLGSWTSNFVIPVSPSGAHIIDAYGSVSQATSVTEVTFTVAPAVTLSRTKGPPGTSVTITGSGFGTNETGITVTYDGTQVVSDISANSQGSWKATFTVPTTPSGTHIVDAFGSISTAVIVSDVTFTSSAGITIDQTAGAYKSSITVNGLGFAPNETGITVTYDGTPVATGIKADAQGAWKATFTIPASASGTHIIAAYGSTTAATSLEGVGLNVTSAISISPATGSVGMTVEVTGSGFAPSSELRFTYDNIEIPSEGVTTDASGSFSKSIIVPKSKAGIHTIRVVDSQRNESSLPFTMENTPPPVPRLLSPTDGARAGFLGGATPTFKWSGVSDPSGVTYVLQVDTTPDFVQPILERADILGTSYTLTKAEALPRGDYYWRVKAVDGASNQSAWSPGWSLSSGLMSPVILVIIIVLGVALIVTALYFFAIRPLMRRRAAIPVPEAAAPQVFPGQWREVEPEEATRARLLPFRRALPQPTKAVKTIPAEELAHFKVITDFAQSLPLVEPGYDTEWVIDVLRSSMGIELSPPVYEQLLRGELSIHYEPAWAHHPLYQELKTLLEGHPILQDLNSFVDTVSRCTSEAVMLLQEIYRETTAEANLDSAKGGLAFVSAVYSDAISWFRGKYLREPSERDYSIKPAIAPGEETEKLWLQGEAGTSFAGLLIPATDEKDALRLRALHLRLRRAYRNSDRARQVVSLMTQLEVQRSRLLNALSQLGSSVESA